MSEKKIVGIFINCKAHAKKEDLDSCGVMKKVYGQCATLNRHFDLIHELINTYSRQTLYKRIKRRLPFTAVGYKWKYDPKYSNADFIYFRKDVVDYSVYNFLRTIKKKNPNCKILFEIPTFPYDNEIKHGFKNQIFYFKDVINRKKLYKCVDRVVTCYKKDKIFGIPTLYMPNGFDFENNPMRNIKDLNGQISIIGVASLAFWHGYDRLIKGMGEYYANGGTRDIVFHCVGDGVALPQLKQLVSDYKLEDKVVFYGMRHRKELDDIYDKCNIAVDCLGLFRKNLLVSSSLKSREYVSKGLPIINNGLVDFIDNDYPYFLNIVGNDEPISMNLIIDFFDSIYINENVIDVSEKIRNYGIERCSWDITLSEVINYIKKNCK